MKQKSWISIVFSFASQCRGKIVLSVVCAIISVAAGLIPYLSVYQIITLFIGGAPVMAEVWKWCWIGLGAYAVRFLFYGISTSLSHISAYTILENIRLALAQRLMKAPLGTVIGEPVGKLKNVMVDRVETIELPLAHMIPECISNLLLPAAVFAYLVCIDWRMALAMLVTLPFVLIAFAMMMKNFNKLYADYMASNNYVNGVIVEYVEGIEVIKAFNQSSSSYEKFTRAVESFKDYTLKWYRSSWKVMNFISAVLPSTFLGTLPIGMYLYWTDSLAPQDLAMCLILSLGIVGPLMNFTTYINEAKTVEYAVRDVDKLLHVEELPDTGKLVELQSKDIQLHDVSFAYDKESNKQALSHIDLKIPEGTFTALVGPSGGGKSTIARLIARFWDVSDGKITIGGVDIRDMPLSSLADIVSFVTQDNFLFNCSIKATLQMKKSMQPRKPLVAMTLYRNCRMAMTQWLEMQGTSSQAAKNSAFPSPV